MPQTNLIFSYKFFRSQINETLFLLAIILVIFALVIFSFIIKETHQLLPPSALAQQYQGLQQRRPRLLEQQQQLQQQPSSTRAGLSINRSLDIVHADKDTVEQNAPN
jgi:hypothetical protein